MESVVLVIHLIFALAIICLVLLQRSEGGGLGIGGGGGGLGGFASAKGTANALTKMTAICAAGFFVTSLTLGVLASRQSQQNIGLLENVNMSQVEQVDHTNNKSDSSGAIRYIPPNEAKNLDSSQKGSEGKAAKVVEKQPEKLKHESISQTRTEEPSAPVE